MKNNIKKAPVKFWEDLFLFSAFYADFCFCSKLVIITTLTDRPDMTLDVYRGRKTTIQQQQQQVSFYYSFFQIWF